MDQILFNKACELIPDPSYIVNLFDLHFIWVDTAVITLSGYSLKEFTEMRNLDVIEEVSEDEARNKFLERITKGEGTTTLTCKVKGGKRVRFTADFKTFEYEREMYIVGKVLETGILNPDNSYTKLDLAALEKGTITTSV